MFATCILCGAICPAIAIWGAVMVGCECMRSGRNGMCWWFGGPFGRPLIVHIDHDPGDESD